MQELRIIVSGQCIDEATAQLVTNTVVDAITQYGFVIDAAPWTKDLSISRKAEWAAQQAQAAAEVAASNQTAIDAIQAALDADTTISEEVRAAINSTIQTATGRVIRVGPRG